MRLFSTITVVSLATTLLSALPAFAAPAKPTATAVPYPPPVNSGPVGSPTNASWTPHDPDRSFFNDKAAWTPVGPDNSRNVAPPSQKSLTPIWFHEFYLYEGCHTDQYHSPECSGSCPLWTFTINIPWLREFCVYHTGALDTTSCVIFGGAVNPQDVNYFLEQIFHRNLFNFKSKKGISTWAWAQGWVVAPDKSYINFGVSIQAGNHQTLGTTLGPDQPYDESLVAPSTNTGKCK
ncbi:hypothetical protein EMPS_07830 [Entomortierella parvispora]|uniref:Uncharacterized protein n=1 Tax=Entomortierella parvispora TaxID=205924 RepID=A0A9P3LYT5_9FUNG|nr:hypothetical protein EMPS_07830 [Entomortierella parvispora]